MSTESTANPAQQIAAGYAVEGQALELGAVVIDGKTDPTAQIRIPLATVQQWMVRSGWALSFVQYSHVYDRDEAIARGAHSGLWAGAFIAPWDWRHRSTATVILGAASVPINAQTILLSAASAAAAPDPDCTIKANISRMGCIYHQQADRWYAKMNMDLRGKRWFCSTEEAEAAGCRAPR